MVKPKKRFYVLSALLCMCFALLTPACGAAPEPGFSDVAPDAWYADAVSYCQAQGLMSGTSGSAFSPEETTSRAMLVTVLYRRAGSPAAALTGRFSDVAESAWYASAVDWAASNGIVSGYADGRFGGEDPVTREQLAVILWRGAGSPAPGTVRPFADQAQIAAYAVDAVAWAKGEGIVGGMEDDRFEPVGGATRAQLAAMLFRWLGQADAEETENIQEEEAMPKLTVRIGGQTFTATLSDNPAARVLADRLPMTVTMGELNGNEKYYFMPDSLPTDPERPGSIHAGDLMLYGDDCLVLFYESFSSAYSYTRLGSLDDPDGLSAALGSGGAEVTFRAE